MPNLFDNVQIGSLTIKNRLIMPALNLRYCPEGQVGERIIRFYERRAAGGVGLIVVGKCLIEEPVYGDSLGVGHDRYINGLKQMTKTLHLYGTKVAAQLGHDGGNTPSKRSHRQTVAPSALPYRSTGETPHALNLREIQEIIRLFGQAARRVKAAGFDAVEVMGSAGNLVSQFLSPLTNIRDDEYGGSPPKRMRFGLELAKIIKQEAGSDYPIIFRISGHDFMPGGNTNKEALEFCVALEKAGVDAFNVTGGWHESPVPQISMQVPRGAMVHLARGIKEAVLVPVVACNRITTPELAATIIDNEAADLVGLARVLVADPDWPIKAQEGRSRSIRPCIACNQGCLDETFNYRPMRCLVNPEVGEETGQQIKPAAKNKRVLVIGGGPGGLEAARIAAKRGHSVTLWEQEPILGGQLLLAGRAPGREEWETLLNYLTTAMEQSGVNIQVGKKGSLNDIMAYKPDVLIVATGAEPAVPDIPGIETTVLAGDILFGRVVPGRRVVVIGAGATGCETALYLARQGAMSPETAAFFVRHRAEDYETLAECLNSGSKEITIIEAGAKAGESIGLSTRWVVLSELAKAGVTILTKSRVLGISVEGVSIEKDSISQMLTADTVVLAGGARSRDKLFKELENKIPEIFAIGDAIGPRNVMDAIHDGYRIASKI